MFVVPKKKFKHANDRNKLKRRMREAYRLQKKEFYDKMDGNKTNINLAFIYIGNTDEPYQVIFASVQKLLTLK